MHGTYHGTLFFMFLAIFRADFWYSGVFCAAEHKYDVNFLLRDTVRHDTGYGKKFFYSFGHFRGFWPEIFFMIWFSTTGKTIKTFSIVPG